MAHITTQEKTLTSLSRIPSEHRQRAFALAIKNCEPKIGRLQMIDSSNAKEAIVFAKDFFGLDSIVTSLGQVWGQDDERTCLGIIQEGFSFILLDGDGDIAALCLNKLLVKNGKDEISHLKPLARLSDFCSSKCDLFSLFGIEQLVDIFLVVVHAKFRRKGLGKFITQFSLEYLRNLLSFTKLKSLGVKVEVMSNYMRKICDDLGLQKMDDVRYEEFVENGRPVIVNTGEHETYTTYATLIENKGY